MEYMYSMVGWVLLVLYNYALFEVLYKLNYFIKRFYREIIIDYKIKFNCYVM